MKSSAFNAMLIIPLYTLFNMANYYACSVYIYSKTLEYINNKHILDITQIYPIQNTPMRAYAPESLQFTFQSLRGCTNFDDDLPPKNGAHKTVFEIMIMHWHAMLENWLNGKCTACTTLISNKYFAGSLIPKCFASPQRFDYKIKYKLR